MKRSSGFRFFARSFKREGIPLLKLKLKLKLIVLLILSPLLSSCGWLFGDNGFFPDRSNDYLRAEKSESIELPKGLSIVRDDEDVTGQKSSIEYEIPELAVSQVLASTFEVPRVESLDVVENKGSVRIQRFESEQWVLVNSSTGQTWPLVRSFLLSNQIPLEVEDGARGIIETAWLKYTSGQEESGANIGTDVEASSLAKSNNVTTPNSENIINNEKYRFMLKQGVQKDTTEIIVRHLSASFVGEGVSLWTPKSSDASREDNMVNLLAEHLAGSPNQASYSLLAQGIGSVSKVTLNYDGNGVPYLDLRLPFDRAWASLGLALKKASYEVNDLDRSQGVYYVRYVPREEKQKKRGFFKRLFSFGRKEKPLNDEDLLLVKTVYKEGSLQITIAR